MLDPRPLAACHTAAGTLCVMGTSAATRYLDPLDSFIGGCHTVSSPQRVIPEYGSSPEIAGTPAPGSAFISSFGLRPPFDRWCRCGQSAHIRLMTDQAGRKAPHPPSITRRYIS